MIISTPAVLVHFHNLLCRHFYVLSISILCFHYYRPSRSRTKILKNLHENKLRTGVDFLVLKKTVHLQNIASLFYTARKAQLVSLSIGQPVAFFFLMEKFLRISFVRNELFKTVEWQLQQNIWKMQSHNPDQFISFGSCTLPKPGRKNLLSFFWTSSVVLWKGRCPSYTFTRRKGLLCHPSFLFANTDEQCFDWNRWQNVANNLRCINSLLSPDVDFFARQTDTAMFW